MLQIRHTYNDHSNLVKSRTADQCYHHVVHKLSPFVRQKQLQDMHVMVGGLTSNVPYPKSQGPPSKTMYTEPLKSTCQMAPKFIKCSKQGTRM